ncbi:MAG TPA: MFS transporter, partial [Micromonosporaceae bacterium]
IAGAGLFVLFSGRVVAVADMASFGCAALAMLLVRAIEARPVREPGHWRTEMTAGIRFAMGNVALRRTTVAFAATMLMVGAVEALFFAYVGIGLHRPPAFISVLLTAQGVGGLLGAGVASRVLRRIGEMGTLAVGLASFGVCMGLLIYPSLAVGFAAMPIAGASIAWIMVAYSTLLQRQTPGELMGRVSAATGVLISGAQALSIAAGAILVSLVDYRILFAVIAAAMLGIGGYLWLVRVPDEEPAVVPEPVAVA